MYIVSVAAIATKVNSGTRTSEAAKSLNIGILESTKIMFPCHVRLLGGHRCRLSIMKAVRPWQDFLWPPVKVHVGKRDEDRQSSTLGVWQIMADSSSV